MNYQKHWDKIFTQGLLNVIRENERYLATRYISKETKNILAHHNIINKEQFNQWGGYTKLYPMIQNNTQEHWATLTQPEESVREYINHIFIKQQKEQNKN